ncbi:serine protease nudel [Eurytemora carolleeae]|uniref:serine protease nudel n=1 Tax=Eurytemora carolleeae TaxID=1294199 RepID=UPI000C771055|nr:serine protease nudel [Eurytemora carolleeae]|eukprot:XP_023343087.1 serine protease nudel-like [Eurytemora affinis]
MLGSCVYHLLPGSLKGTIFLQVASLNATGWAGALGCPDNEGFFYAVGLFDSASSSPPTRFKTVISQAVRTALQSLLESNTFENAEEQLGDTCNGFRCDLGNCLKKSQLCDGKWDCIDGKDEKYCSIGADWPKCEPMPDRKEACLCPQGLGKCNNNLCIPGNKFCDGVDDCGDGSDEGPNCKQCIERIRFFRSWSLCNGVVDCNDGSDEAPDLCGCPEKTFRCNIISQNLTDNAECSPIEHLCNGKNDCRSGKDEDHRTCLTLGSKYGVTENELMQPQKNSNGYLKFRMQGVWYTYCYEGWTDEMSAEMCKTLGFKETRIWIQHIPVEVKDLGLMLTGVASKPAKVCKLIYIVCQ